MVYKKLYEYYWLKGQTSERRMQKENIIYLNPVKQNIRIISLIKYCVHILLKILEFIKLKKKKSFNVIT